MSQYQSELLNTLHERGFIQDTTDAEGLDKLLQTPGQPVYIGFDCTADSLHVGSLLQIMTLYWIQQSGHKPIVLLGGGTTKIGDPSGKDEARQLLDDAGIAKNLEGIRSVFDKFLTFGNGDSDALMVNNDDWLSSLNYIDFLRDVSRHFSVNRMLTMESVKRRLDRDQPLSFLEFNYMVLQAYDFCELADRHDCRVQIGGSDQWGNIVMGIDLGRRLEKGELFGLTTPLITTSSGAKMGKTAQGAVWLNEDRVSAYDYWQFWRNTDDADVGRFLRLFTTLSMDEIAKLEALEGAEINQAKIALANAATGLCHGEDAAKQAEATAKETFEQGAASAGLPSFNVDAAELEAGVPLFAALQTAELAESGGAARRLIKGGGARVNDAQITDEQHQLTHDDVQEGQIKLSSGKKRHALLVIS